ncbi:hypothetical protein GCM10020000_68200 [Streptomyces olivoverticillatus]
MPQQYADSAAKVPVLGKTVIPKEKLLGSGADLYVDSFSSMKNMGKTGDAPPRPRSSRPPGSSTCS